MKTVLLVPFLLTAAAAYAADSIEFVSPDKSSTLVVEKSGKHDFIELKSEKTVHRLFYEGFDPLFQPKLAEAFGTSLNVMGKVVPPTFTSVKWLSADEVEIKGKSNVIINHDAGDAFTFIALISKAGSVKDLTVTPVLESRVQGRPPSSDPEVPPTPPKGRPTSIERPKKSEP